MAITPADLPPVPAFTQKHRKQDVQIPEHLFPLTIETKGLYEDAGFENTFKTAQDAANKNSTAKSMAAAVQLKKDDIVYPSAQQEANLKQALLNHLVLQVALDKKNLLNEKTHQELDAFIKDQVIEIVGEFQLSALYKRAAALPPSAQGPLDLDGIKKKLRADSDNLNKLIPHYLNEIETLFNKQSTTGKDLLDLKIPGATNVHYSIGEFLPKTPFPTGKKAELQLPEGLSEYCDRSIQTSLLNQSVSEAELGVLSPDPSRTASGPRQIS